MIYDRASLGNKSYSKKRERVGSPSSAGVTLFVHASETPVISGHEREISVLFVKYFSETAPAS